MDKELFRQLIIEKIKLIKLDYEDFIGYSYSDDPDVWMHNLLKVLPDTYQYSLLKNDKARMQLIENIFTELAEAYKTLEKKEQPNNEVS